MSAKWTAETIYRFPLPGGGNRMPPIVDERVLQAETSNQTMDSRTFTDAYVSELQRETEDGGEWILDEVEPLNLSRSELSSVMAGGTCPVCQGIRRTVSKTGRITLINVLIEIPCICTSIRRFGFVWNDPKIVPPRYRDVTWESLAVQAPEDKSVTRKTLMHMDNQRHNIGVLRAHPDDSYLFVGEAGCGKTHYSIALLHYHLKKWIIAALKDPRLSDRPVFRLQTKELMDQHRAWEIKEEGDNTPAPDLTIGMVRSLYAKGHRVILFLDELDKFSPTEWKMTTLYELLNAIYEVDGRIIVVSNASIAHLRRKWAQYSSAEPILRRFGKPEARGRQLAFAVNKIERSAKASGQTSKLETDPADNA